MSTENGAIAEETLANWMLSTIAEEEEEEHAASDVPLVNQPNATPTDDGAPPYPTDPSCLQPGMKSLPTSSDIKGPTESASQPSPPWDAPHAPAPRPLPPKLVSASDFVLPSPAGSASVTVFAAAPPPYMTVSPMMPPHKSSYRPYADNQSASQAKPQYERFVPSMPPMSTTRHPERVPELSISPSTSTASSSFLSTPSSSRASSANSSPSERHPLPPPISASASALNSKRQSAPVPTRSIAHRSDQYLPQEDHWADEQSTAVGPDHVHMQSQRREQAHGRRRAQMSPPEDRADRVTPQSRPSRDSRHTSMPAQPMPMSIVSSAAPAAVNVPSSFTGRTSGFEVVSRPSLSQQRPAQHTPTSAPRSAISPPRGGPITAAFAAPPQSLAPPAPSNNSQKSGKTPTSSSASLASKNSAAPSDHMDLVDALDVTDPLGYSWHHDGPYAAVNANLGRTPGQHVMKRLGRDPAELTPKTVNGGRNARDVTRRADRYPAHDLGPVPDVTTPRAAPEIRVSSQGTSWPASDAVPPHHSSSRHDHSPPLGFLPPEQTDRNDFNPYDLAQSPTRPTHGQAPVVAPTPIAPLPEVPRDSPPSYTPSSVPSSHPVSAYEEKRRLRASHEASEHVEPPVMPVHVPEPAQPYSNTTHAVRSPPPGVQSTTDLHGTSAHRRIASPGYQQSISSRATSSSRSPPPSHLPKRLVMPTPLQPQASVIQHGGMYPAMSSSVPSLPTRASSVAQSHTSHERGGSASSGANRAAHVPMLHDRGHNLLKKRGTVMEPRVQPQLVQPPPVQPPLANAHHSHAPVVRERYAPASHSDHGHGHGRDFSDMSDILYGVQSDHGHGAYARNPFPHQDMHQPRYAPVERFSAQVPMPAPVPASRERPKAVLRRSNTSNASKPERTSHTSSTFTSWFVPAKDKSGLTPAPVNNSVQQGRRLSKRK